MPEPENENIKSLVKRIKDLEEEKAKGISERGALEAELKKLKDELEEANAWI